MFVWFLWQTGASPLELLLFCLVKQDCWCTWKFLKSHTTLEKNFAPSPHLLPCKGLKPAMCLLTEYWTSRRAYIWSWFLLKMGTMLSISRAEVTWRHTSTWEEGGAHWLLFSGGHFKAYWIATKWLWPCFRTMDIWITGEFPFLPQASVLTLQE